MTDLQDANYISSPDRSEGEVKQFFEDMLARIKEVPGGAPISELTIDTGVVTPIRAVHTIDTEGEASDDTLTNIALDNLSEGAILEIYAENAARVVTVQHLNGATDGEISLISSVDVALSTIYPLRLRRVGVQWVEVRAELISWASQPIGVPIPVWAHLTGVETPPKSPTGPCYILLTAGEDGVGEYNENLLASESVSGSAPLVIATADIDLAASPLYGETVNLINSERRFLRAGSSGTVEADAFQGHRQNPLSPATAFVGNAGSSSGAWLDSVSGYNTAQPGTTGDPVTDGVNGTPRTASETRSKNVGATYYMRIL